MELDGGGWADFLRAVASEGAAHGFTEITNPILMGSAQLESWRQVFGEAALHFVDCTDPGDVIPIDYEEAAAAAMDRENGYEVWISMTADVPSEASSWRRPAEKREEVPKLRHEDWSDQLAERLGSRPFLEALQEFPDPDQVIGRAIEYHGVFQDGYRFEEFLEQFRGKDLGDNAVDRDVRRFMVATAAEQLGVEAESPEDKSALFDFFYRRLKTEGCYYHAFNGTFEDDIARRGLDPHDRQWDWGDLKRIQAIGERVGHRMLLGWAGINSEGLSSISATPAYAYKYGVDSPEWFSQFVGGGFHVAPDGNNKKAFARRDYDQAKANVLRFCDAESSKDEAEITAGQAYPNLALEEKTEILAFFEKYWKKLAGEKSGPKLLRINSSFLDRQSSSDSLASLCERMRWDIESVDVAEILPILRRDSAVDMQIDKRVPPDALTVMDLPTYTDVHPA